jgi:D-arabinose 1-dehydrogenase-like Zn-dependent alcohol dehydrogenase
MYNAKAYSAATARSQCVRLAYRRYRRQTGDARFCGSHNIAADVEVIPIQKVNEAYQRLLKSDVKYRFSIEMASLKSE